MSFLATNVTVFVLNCCFIFNFRLIKKVPLKVAIPEYPVGAIVSIKI